MSISGTGCPEFEKGKIYEGRDRDMNVVIIRVTKVKDPWMYYETNTGITGRVLFDQDAFGECVIIRKLNRAYVSAANLCK